MAYKSVQKETTVAAAIGDAMSEFQSLGEEMRETYDNMESANMGHMDKCQRSGEAADELEQHVDEPDIPEWLGEMKVTYTEMVNKRKGASASRAIRLSNAQAMIQAARDVVDAWESEDDEPGAEETGKKEEAEQLVSDLDEHCEFDVDFPGMFG